MGPRQLMALARSNAPWLSDPRYAQLRSTLLALGGDEVVLVEEPDMAVLLARGKVFPGDGARFEPMDARSCHWNAAKLWERSRGRIKMATGWALSDDGLWRSHSWGWDGKRVWETTEPRVMYYGTILSGERARDFYVANMRRA